MATSSIQLFKTNITPQRNCIVDDIEEYLDTCNVTYSCAAFQYQKIALDIVVKIVEEQLNQANGEIGNYCRIYQNSKPYYFFIMKVNWTSQNTLELSLSMDTLNTFKNDYTLSEKTKIIRQHKDRFVIDTTWTSGATLSLHKVIDMVDEQIQVTKYKTVDNKVLESGYKNQNWYLVYRNKTDQTSNYPLEVALLPTDQTPYATGYLSTVTWRPSDLTQGEYYFFPDESRCYKYYSSTVIDEYKYDVNNGIIQVVASPVGTHSTLTFTTPTEYYIGDFNNQTISTLFNSTKYLIKAGASGTAYLKKISEIDRTDSKIVKIIELGYMPADFTWNGNVLSLPSGWIINTNQEIILNNLFKEFEHSIATISLENTLTLSEACGTNKTTFTKKTKSITRETKFLHSAFHTHKFTYDSFAQEYALERVNYDYDRYGEMPEIEIKFKPSNTIDSSLAFKFSSNYATYKQISDYDSFLLSNRNNEIALLTSEYLNYMRVGYNYDQKAKNRTEASSWLSTGLSLLGAVAAFASSSVTGGVGLAAGVGLATSAMSGIASSIQTTISQENALEEKLKELQAQSVNVSNSNDINLFNYYSENKLHQMTYDPSDIIKADIFDLFYYCGYLVNMSGTPDVSSRWWFNYIQCEPVFKTETSDATYQNYIEDIRQRYQLGVTVYHNRNNTWNFDQTYENWETWLLDE